MLKKRRLSQAESLELYHALFTDIKNDPNITRIMMANGFSKAQMEKGKTLYVKVKNAFDLKRKNEDASLGAYNKFLALKNALKKSYMLHRKKAKVVFRKERELQIRLGLTGSLANTYHNWLETVKRFYTEALADKEIQKQLSRLNISVADLRYGMTALLQLEERRSEYLKKEAESQDATKIKIRALAFINEWMREFYAVGKIALESRPQVLELLRKFVRS